MSNGSETAAPVVTGTGVALTAAPINWIQVAGLAIAVLGLAWNVYSVITRNRHNRYLRERQAAADAAAADQGNPPAV